MSLFKRIFLVISVLMIIIWITLTSTNIYRQKENIESEFDYNMRANMSIIMSQLDQTVTDYTTIGLSFANNKEFTEYFTSLDLEDEKLVHDVLQILKQIKNSSDLLNNVTLTPKDGVIRLDALDAFYEDGVDESEFEYFRELSSDPSKDTYINKPLIGTANNEPIFGIGVQMENQGDFLGIIGLPINFNRLVNQAIMPDITDEELEILMVNSSGTIVWASNTEYIHNTDMNLDRKEYDLFQEIKTNQFGSTQKIILGTNAQIRYEYYDVFDMYVVIYKDIAGYNQQIFHLILTSLLLGLLFLIITSILLYFILQKITQPINKLAEYSDHLAEENFNIVIPNSITNRKDEIGVLGRQYQTMVDNLQSSFNKIQSFAEKNETLANQDDLTGLPNRRNFENNIQVLQDKNAKGSILIMDIDHFKNINDTMGHVFGDSVLRAAASVLSTLSNNFIKISRFSADEFIVCIIENKEGTRSEYFVNSVRQLFSNPLDVSHNLVDVKFSIGMSQFPESSTDIDELMRQADIALYMAKNEGRNRLKIFNLHMEKIVFKKIDIENKLIEASKNNGFKLLYQPQVDLTTGKVTCFEALLRLKDNSYFPNDFIPIAEDTLRIIEIGRWVVKEAIEQLARWNKEYTIVPKVSVNLSGVQLRDNTFHHYIADLLAKNEVSGEQLELEITENVFILHEKSVSSFFEKITKLGISLSIDDFGTGYSSLTYIISFPVDKIKLDKQIVDKYLHESGDDTIANLIKLIHDLNYLIVAEGVEEQSDVETLRDKSCDYIQGYYFSRPLDPEDIVLVDYTYKI